MQFIKLIKLLYFKDKIAFGINKILNNKNILVCNNYFNQNK